MHLIRNNSPARQVRPASAYLPSLQPRHARDAARPVTVRIIGPATAMAAIVNAACKRHGMAPSRFGRGAVGDPRLVGDLDRGRVLREESAERVINFISALDAAKGVSRA
jgi:hypothetical protein